MIEALWKEPSEAFRQGKKDSRAKTRARPRRRTVPADWQLQMELEWLKKKSQAASDARGLRKLSITTTEITISRTSGELLGYRSTPVATAHRPVPESTLGDPMAGSMRCHLEDPTSGSPSDGSVFGRAGIR